MPTPQPANKEVAQEIMEQFNKWADNLIVDYKSMPTYSPQQDIRLRAQADLLGAAKSALARIVKEVK